jgi:hypothetical protein
LCLILFKTNKLKLKYIERESALIKYPDLFSLEYNSRLELYKNIVLYNGKYYLNKIPDFNFTETEEFKEIEEFKKINIGNYCKNFFHSICFTEK